MSFNYPEFLQNEGDMAASPRPSLPQLPPHRSRHPSAAYDPNHPHAPLDGNPMLPPIPANTFSLPAELQGGIGTISLRRPLYAAELFTRNQLANLLPGQMPPGSGPGGGPQPVGLAPQPQPSAPSPYPPSQAFFQGHPAPRMALYAIMNNATHFKSPLESVGEKLGLMLLNSNYSEFQQRRPLQLVDFQQGVHPAGPPGGPASYRSPPQRLAPQTGSPVPSAATTGATGTPPTGAAPLRLSPPKLGLSLENGLMLNNQYIVALPDLKALYAKTMAYFQDPQMTQQIISQLHNLLTQPPIVKLITFIKNLNNLTFHNKILCLVINKNGKFDLLSYPTNLNIYLQKDDLVIVDGDRGKDLVMIVEPLVNLNFAILFNFLKKLEHLKSLTITDHKPHQNGLGRFQSLNHKANGTHSTQLDALAIINSHANEDNEFIITLPTKQVLRFATPKEVHKVLGKFLEEKKAFITCYNKINELNLADDLQLINVEYQLDFKKLIFYYFAGFKRIDFRGLIKELFKIYKTRIWLCAVLPYDRPQLYVTMEPRDFRPAPPPQDKLGLHQHATIPHEYELSNDQILNFSIGEFDSLAPPNYFHLANLQNLIRHLQNEILGHFYGFNAERGSPVKSALVLLASAGDKLAPTFNPFDDNDIFKLNFQLNK